MRRPYPNRDRWWPNRHRQWRGNNAARHRDDPVARGRLFRRPFRDFH